MAGRSGCRRAVAPERAVLALLEHGSLSEAAKALGIERRTLGRWVREPEFEQLYAQARHDALSAGVARLGALVVRAVENLEMLLADPDTPPAIRARVSDSILGRAFQGFELVDLAARVSALEAAAQGGGS